MHPVFTNDNPVNLDKLEEIFLDGWVDNVTRSFHETQLHIFAWGSETAISFVNRMTALYVNRHISLKATRVETPEIAQLIKELFLRLPPSVRSSSGMTRSDYKEYNSLQELLDEIRQYPEVPRDVKLALPCCYYCAGEVQWTCLSRCDSYMALQRHKPQKIALLKKRTFVKVLVRPLFPKSRK